MLICFILITFDVKNNIDFRFVEKKKVTGRKQI